MCNKADDPDDEEQRELIRNASAKVQQVFGVEDRSTALRQIVNKRLSTATGLYPVFIPMSAVNAFIYQSANEMTLEQFKKFDSDLVLKFGKEQIGKSLWNLMSSEEKVKKTYELVISDLEQYEEGLKASNFDKFLDVFPAASMVKKLRRA